MDFGQATVVSATGTVNARPTRLLGFYVNSTSSGTLILYDAASATNAISGTITPAVGWHSFPASCGTGLHVAVGGTINVTFIYQPT